MADYRDHHATVFLAPRVAGVIEELRQEWDPSMAALIPAHITLVYPREAPLVGLLVERLQNASAQALPFRLRVGGSACFGRPEDGVYVQIVDLDGGYSKLRATILQPPFEPVQFPPHVTLVHPRTSSRGRACWETA